MKKGLKKKEKRPRWGEREKRGGEVRSLVKGILHYHSAGCWRKKSCRPKLSYTTRKKGRKAGSRLGKGRDSSTPKEKSGYRLKSIDPTEKKSTPESDTKLKSTPVHRGGGGG